MVRGNIINYALVGKDAIVFSKSTLNIKEEVTRIKYRVDIENKEIRLYDVPRILDFQEKSIIYYALLDMFYFSAPTPLLDVKHEYGDFENYVVKENGYSYHTFNGIEKEDYGILAELLFEIPRQEIEVEKLSRIRDIYELLERNMKAVGKRPICIAFNGIMSDFKDIFKTIEYMFDNHEELKAKRDELRIFKRNSLFGGNKRIYIVPKDIQKALREMEEEERKEREAKLLEIEKDINDRIENGVKVIQKEEEEKEEKITESKEENKEEIKVEDSTNTVENKEAKEENK